MATGGISSLECLESEDLSDVVCDPCQDDGELHKAVGMCVDCQDYLCQSCFDGHKIARVYRKHKLLDKESMLKSQVVITKDKCTEKCSVHEDDVIKFYCITHCQLGCGVCMTLDHRSCDSVTYIPHVANDLANNEEYKQAENHLKSVVQRFSNITDDIKQKSDTLERYCSEAVKEIREFRKEIHETLVKIESDIIKKCEALKSKEQNKMEQIVNKFKATQKELQCLISTTQVYQNNKQSCKLYTTIIKTKDQLKLADDKVKKAEKEQLNVNSLIEFVANNKTLETMKHSKALGQLSISGPAVIPRSEETTVKEIKPVTFTKQNVTRTVVGLEYIQEINVKSTDDNNTCLITGLAVLSDNKVVITDYLLNEYGGFLKMGEVGNGTVKLMDVNHNKVITTFKLSSAPFDVAMTNHSQIAVTLPRDKKVALVNVAATAMTVDTELRVDGPCYGVDYKEDKLAVTFRDPERIQVLTLQGSVLHTISNSDAYKTLWYMNTPELRVVFGHDNTSLYVSSPYNNKVVHMKFDGTTIDTYTHNELEYPQGLVTSTSGHVYVCGGYSNNIHQITPECKKKHVFLNELGDISKPCAIGYNETECTIYVGMNNNNKIKVYKAVFGTQ